MKNHTRFELELFTKEDPGVSLKLLGEVTGFMPLRSRRNGEHTYIGEGMTKYTLLSHTGLPAAAVATTLGFGMSEYLDQGRGQNVVGPTRGPHTGKAALSVLRMHTNRAARACHSVLSALIREHRRLGKLALIADPAAPRRPRANGIHDRKRRIATVGDVVWRSPTLWRKTKGVRATAIAQQLGSDSMNGAFVTKHPTGFVCRDHMRCS